MDIFNVSQRHKEYKVFRIEKKLFMLVPNPNKSEKE